MPMPRCNCPTSEGPRGHAALRAELYASVALLLLLAAIAVGAGRALEMEAVDAPTFVVMPEEDGSYGASVAVEVEVRGDVDGHLRAQLLSGRKVVGRMWNGTEWVYPWAFDRCLRVNGTDGWRGHVLMRLYRPYFPDGGPGASVVASLALRNGTERADISFNLSVVGWDDASLVRVQAFDGEPLCGAPVSAGGDGRALALSAGLDVVAARVGPQDPDGTRYDDAVRWPGESVLALTPGTWNVSVGGLSAVVDVGADGAEVAIGEAVRSDARLQEACIRPRDGGCEWMEAWVGSRTDLRGWTVATPGGFAVLNCTRGPGPVLLLLDGGDTGDGPEIHLPIADALPDDGGYIALLSPGGALADLVSYGSGATVAPPPCWPAGDRPDGSTGYIVAEGVPGNRSWRDEWWGDSTPGHETPSREVLRDASLRIVEVMPDGFVRGDGDEHVVVMNVGNSTVDLEGWDLADGADVFTLPGTLGPGARMMVCANATAAAASMPWINGSTEPALGVSPPDAVVDGSSVGLDNDGDAVLLRWRRGVVDAVAWGDARPRGGWRGEPLPAPWEGEILVRGGAAGWNSTRLYRAGQTRLRPVDLTADAVLTLVTADCGDGEALSMIEAANVTVTVEAYELRSGDIAGALANASLRGAEVRVMLDGGPVGWDFRNVPVEDYLERPGAYGNAYAEKALCEMLAAAGCDVMFSIREEGPYRYVHSKCIVADDAVLLSSDNLVDGSFPHAVRCDGLSVAGSRGWAAVLHGEDVAAFFREVIDSDMAGAAVVPWGEPPYDAPPDHFDLLGGVTGPTASRPPAAVGPFLRRPVRFDGPMVVTPVLAPDTSASGATVLSVLMNATGRLYVELLDLDPDWGRRGANLFLDAVVDAARRGVDVRVLLDPTWARAGGDRDNHEMLSDLENLSTEVPGLACRFISKHGLTMLHNKGVVSDDSALVSSVNWGYNSVFMNREMGVVIRSKAVADHYARAFLHDWNRSLLDVMPVAVSGPGEWRLDVGPASADAEVRVLIDGAAVGSWSLTAGCSTSMALAGLRGLLSVEVDGVVLEVLEVDVPAAPDGGGEGGDDGENGDGDSGSPGNGTDGGGGGTDGGGDDTGAGGTGDGAGTGGGGGGGDGGSGSGGDGDDGAGEDGGTGPRGGADGPAMPAVALAIAVLLTAATVGTVACILRFRGRRERALQDRSGTAADGGPRVRRPARRRCASRARPGRPSARSRPP